MARHAIDWWLRVDISRQWRNLWSFGTMSWISSRWLGKNQFRSCSVSSQCHSIREHNPDVSSFCVCGMLIVLVIVLAGVHCPGFG